MPRHLPLLVVVPLVALALAAAGSGNAAVYKWVDEKGVVHYTDKMPSDAVDKGSVELNKQAIPIRRTDPVPTPEQRRAKQADEDRQKQVAREREVVDRRDRALLESYASAEEIDLARSRAVGTLESQVESAQAYSVALGKRRQELDVKRKSYGDKAVPPTVERELENIATELAKQDSLVADRKHEIAAVGARYDADKQRWQELRAMSAGREGGVAPGPQSVSTRSAGAASPR